MVLTTTRRTSNNKENAFGKTSILRGKFTTKAHRKRTSFLKTYLTSPAGSSKVCDAAHRTGCSSAAPTDVGVSNLTVAGDHIEPGPIAVVPCDEGARRKISLPKHLRRPTYRAISSAALTAIDPELSEVPIEYIRQKLQSVGEQMQSASRKITAKCPRGRLPRELEVTLDNYADIPTHVLAVYSQSSILHKQRVALHPAHALVLAAQCAHLPPLPYSKPTGEGDTVTLPVLPLRLPSPGTFHLLLNYLYTHRVDVLLSAMLPISQSDSQPQEASQKLAEVCTVSTLLTHAHTTHGLWSNVAALGVFDETLWRIIDHAWAVLLGALSAKTGESWSPRTTL